VGGVIESVAIFCVLSVNYLARVVPPFTASSRAISGVSQFFDYDTVRFVLMAMRPWGITWTSAAR
jgi:hypothetical protein